MATFELFSARIPTDSFKDIKDPLILLEKLAYYQVVEATNILDNNQMKYSLGWYGKPSPDMMEFQLLLDLPSFNQSIAFGLFSNLDPV
jgi:hypothetical protein